MSEHSPEDIAKAERRFRARLVAYTLGDSGELEPKNAVILERGGLISRADHVEVAREDALQEFSWLGGVKGPLLVVTDEEPRTVRRLRDGVLGMTVEARTHALNRLAEIGEESPPRLLASTRERAKEGAAALTSDVEDWQSTGLELHDLLREDFLLNLAGLEQCLVDPFQLGFREFIRAVFTPSETSARNLLTEARPLPDKAQCSDLIAHMKSESENTIELLQRYFEQLGHLPLAGELSAGAVLTTYLDQDADNDEMWSDVWSWADATGSPLAQYHACQIFAYEPGRAPKAKTSELLERTYAVVAPFAQVDNSYHVPAAWRLLVTTQGILSASSRERQANT